MRRHSARPRAARRSAERHRTIIEAAAALVAEAGYDAATIEGVAGRAGAGKQTIYRWWPSKAALFVEVYTHLVPAEALRPNSGRVADDLRQILRRLFTIYQETAAGVILAGLIADAQSDAAAADAVKSGLVVGRRGLLIEPLGRGIARGELAADFDAGWANDTIVARIWHRLLTDRAALHAAFADELVDKVLRR